MSYKNILQFTGDFDDCFIRLSGKIETAHSRSEQLEWQNHRKWYMKLVRETKNKLKKLKISVKSISELEQILINLESTLKNIFNVGSETNLKWTDLSICRQIFQQFQKELDKKVKAEYDLFRKRGFDEDSKLCFVLMPFDSNFNKVYSKGIKPAIKKSKLIPKRADEIFAVQPVVQDLWEYINKASLLVADLTDRNPNVFYEVGLAHALPKRLIILTQRKEDVPFDLQHIRWIKYENTSKGWKKLSDKLSQTINKVMS